MYQTGEFFSFDEIKQGVEPSQNVPASPENTEPTGDSGLDDDKFLNVTLMTNILAIKWEGYYARRGGRKEIFCWHVSRTIN